jgi:peptidoglycan/LPS O-acetylase OafA/YrhL
MSLLFFVAAYFVPRTADRKGSWGFLRGRLKRLGIPFLVGTATIIPALMYVYFVRYRGYTPISFGRYYLDVFLGLGDQPADWTGPIWPDLQFGHLWFIQNLLAFSVLYALWRGLRGILVLRRARLANPLGWPTRSPGHRALVIVTLALATVVFLIRIHYPLDTWIPLLEFIQAEPARLAQYAVFFGAGVLAYRNDWLTQMPRSTGYTWLAGGVALTAVLFVTGTDTSYFAPGGASWAAACWTIVETFLGVGLSVGLLTLFRDAFAGHNRRTEAVAASSYTIYIIHLPIVVTLQFAFAHTNLPTLATFTAVAGLAILASVGTAMVIRRLPGLRTIL